jgi:hypothetical protein
MIEQNNRKRVKELLYELGEKGRLPDKKITELNRRIQMNEDLNDIAIAEDIDKRYHAYDTDPSVGNMYQRKKKKCKKIKTKRKCKCK